MDGLLWVPYRAVRTYILTCLRATNKHARPVPEKDLYIRHHTPTYSCTVTLRDACWRYNKDGAHLMGKPRQIGDAREIGF